MHGVELLRLDAAQSVPAEDERLPRAQHAARVLERRAPHGREVRGDVVRRPHVVDEDGRQVARRPLTLVPAVAEVASGDKPSADVVESRASKHCRDTVQGPSVNVDVHKNSRRGPNVLRNLFIRPESEHNFSCDKIQIKNLHMSSGTEDHKQRQRCQFCRYGCMEPKKKPKAHRFLFHITCLQKATDIPASFRRALTVVAAAPLTFTYVNCQRRGQKRRDLHQ